MFCIPQCLGCKNGNSGNVSWLVQHTWRLFLVVPMILWSRWVHIPLPLFGGAHGVLLKSWIPSSVLYTERCGWILEVRSTTRLSCTCSNNWSCSWIGKFWSVVHNPEMKWSWKVWIVHLAALTWWLWGLTIWTSMFSFSRNCVMDFETMLSMTLNFGQRPFLVR